MDDRIAIFDLEEERFWTGEDGEILKFRNKIAAKNYLFDRKFSYEFAHEKVLYVYPDYKHHQG